MNSKTDIGRICTARAGRDAGKKFIVVGEVDEHYVLIANGKSRMLAKPKRKKRKHLIMSDMVLENIQVKLLRDAKVFDAELHSALSSANDAQQKEE